MFYIFIFDAGCSEKSNNKYISEFSGEISFGSDWWIERCAGAVIEASYKIVAQVVIDGKRLVCAKPMNRGWIGQDFLGTESKLSFHRQVFPGIFSIPRTIGEWKMATQSL